MENKKFAYARVSAKDQNLERQIEDFKKYGVSERDIFYDKLSGKDFNRKSYQQLTRYMLREGDTFIVKALDRFGRNYEEIHKEWRFITREVKADIIVIDMPLLNTNLKKDLLGSVINDVILCLLAYVAEKERHSIRQRQREGIDLAQKNGIKFGRPEIQIPENWMEWYTKWKQGEVTAREAMGQMGMKKDSFYKLVKKYEANLK